MVSREGPFQGDNAEDIKASKMLDIILYSREQLVKEREATGKADPNRPLPDAPWGIISIKAQDEPFELPMQPDYNDAALWGKAKVDRGCLYRNQNTMRQWRTGETTRLC